MPHNNNISNSNNTTTNSNNSPLAPTDARAKTELALTGEAMKLAPGIESDRRPWKRTVKFSWPRERT